MFHFKNTFKSFKKQSISPKFSLFKNTTNKFPLIKFYVTNKELHQINIKAKQFLIDIQKDNGTDTKNINDVDKSINGYIEGENHKEKSYILGKLLLTGEDGIKKNEKIAFELLNKSAKNGDPKSQYLLGLIYLKGIEGVDPKWEISLEWLVKAANMGHTRAKKDVELLKNKMNQSSITSFEDRLDEEEFEWYRRSSLIGESEAMVVLANHYFKGKGVAKNDTEAVEWLKKAAEQKNSTALCNLGFCYYHGTGVEKNDDKALQYLNKAVFLGNVAAHFTLGVILKKNGDVEKSHFHFQQALLGGNFEAAAELADSLAESDFDKATELAKQACLNGSVFGKYLYGCFILEKSPEEAYSHLKDVALEGYPPAQFQLYQCYMEGIGVEKNYSKGLNWLQSCLNSDYEEAIFEDALINLGYLYPEVDIQRNPEQAVENLKHLSNSGHEDATLTLKEKNLL